MTSVAGSLVGLSLTLTFPACSFLTSPSLLPFPHIRYCSVTPADPPPVSDEPPTALAASFSKVYHVATSRQATRLRPSRHRHPFDTWVDSAQRGGSCRLLFHSGNFANCRTRTCRVVSPELQTSGLAASAVQHRSRPGQRSLLALSRSPFRKGRKRKCGLVVFSAIWCPHQDVPAGSPTPVDTRRLHIVDAVAGLGTILMLLESCGSWTRGYVLCPPFRRPRRVRLQSCWPSLARPCWYSC